MAVGVSPVINAILALFILMSITMGCQSREFTLTVSGADDAEGGHVFINGKWVGTMAKEGEHGSQFVMALPKGTLTVEVKKEGYLPFLAVMTVASQITKKLSDSACFSLCWKAPWRNRLFMKAPRLRRICAHKGSSLGSNTTHCVPR